METLQIIDGANFTLHLTFGGSVVIKIVIVVPVSLSLKKTEEGLVE